MYVCVYAYVLSTQFWQLYATVKFLQIQLKIMNWPLELLSKFYFMIWWQRWLHCNMQLCFSLWTTLMLFTAATTTTHIIVIVIIFSFSMLKWTSVIMCKRCVMMLEGEWTTVEMCFSKHSKILVDNKIIPHVRWHHTLTHTHNFLSIFKFLFVLLQYTMIRFLLFK